MRARFYAPELGRFLTPDPSLLEGGENAYAYAGNRPLDARDPLGLQAEEEGPPRGLAALGRHLEERVGANVRQLGRAWSDVFARARRDALRRLEREVMPHLPGAGSRS